ncbi:hypothetical protein Zmor_010655 [Zophobas morio]|uniref:Uncharacterized protein n=1 Tax=Zophobas morio TaxID=2755281 RepID=A0AA38MK79_9CUCU|nr:hypothetical protein Zmor_010655 [Zophobas morio]
MFRRRNEIIVHMQFPLCGEKKPTTYKVAAHSSAGHAGYELRFVNCHLDRVPASACPITAPHITAVAARTSAGRACLLERVCVSCYLHENNNTTRVWELWILLCKAISATRTPNLN